MSTPAVTLSLVVLGAGILAAVAVAAVYCARRGASLKCPGCDASEVNEEGRLYRCELCGQRWRIETPRRFGSYEGKDS